MNFAIAWAVVAKPRTGGLMHDESESYARRAGREFVAAGRAATPEERRRHRATAMSYQRLIERTRQLKPADDRGD
jgi:hypothetical protein